MKLRHLTTLLLAAGITVGASACVSNVSDELRNTVVHVGTAVNAVKTAYDAACTYPTTEGAYKTCEVAYKAVDAAVVQYTRVNDEIKKAQ